MRALPAILAFLSAVPAFAQDETVGFRIREWYARLNGDLEVEDEDFGVPATTIDIDDELGIDDSEFAHELQGYLNIPVLGRIYLGAWFTRLEGDETLERDITFEDTTFAANERVETELDLDVYYLTYEFPFSPPTGDLVDLEIGLQAGVRVLLAEGAVKSQTFGEERDEGVGALPVVGVHGAISITEWLRADAELVGLTFTYGDTSATYFEAYAEVVGQLGPVFGGVGYKYVRMDIEDSTGSTDFDFDGTLDGVYLTAGVRF